MEIKVLDISKDDIPYSFSITLGEKLYEFFINYNATGDFFTADLKYKDEVLVKGEKILLNQIIFRQIFEDSNLNVDERYPNQLLIPQPNEDSIERLGWEQLGENCFIYVLDRAEVLASV